MVVRDPNDGYRDARIRVQISKIEASVLGDKMNNQACSDKDTRYIIHKYIPKLGMIVVHRPDALLGRWRYAPPVKCQRKPRGGRSLVSGSFRKFQTMRFFQPNDVGYIGDIRSRPQRCPTLRVDVLDYAFLMHKALKRQEESKIRLEEDS